MRRRTWAGAIVLASGTGCGGCDEDAVIPNVAPTNVTMVTSGGFTSPTDAVASPDGKTFYFAALDDARQPSIFSTPSTAGSTATKLASGDPLEAPFGLVLSCDGATLYVGDMGGDGGAIYAVSTSGGTLTSLGDTGIDRPSGLAMTPDCDNLIVTGRTDTGEPAVFKLPTTGGTASVVYHGAPLVSPTGVHIDDDNVSWVMDHLAHGADGQGILFAVTADGHLSEVISNLAMGTPGGVSLTFGGGIAVMPTLDADGFGQLTSVVIETGEMSQAPAPDILDPAGLRTARNAPVFAVVDSEGGAIFRAE